MAGEGVPWMIGAEGAKHPAEVGRRLAWAAMKGEPGVIQPGDFKVLALQTPGGAIRVQPGGVSVENTYPGGKGQVYIAHEGVETQLSVPATGSSGGATYYVIARIADPQYAGNPPANPADGPYWWLDVVNTEAGITYPYELLAHINVPANTATITQAMIVDRRRIAMARTKSEMRTFAVLASQAEQINNYGAYPDGGETWPVETEADWGYFDVPKWATRAKVILHWSGVQVPGGNTWGWAWAQIGFSVNPDHVVTQGTFYDTTGVEQRNRMHLMVADEIRIPAALRGGAHKIYPRANVLGESSLASRLTLDGGSTLLLQVEWMEIPD